MQYFRRLEYSEDYYDDYSTKSPTRSIIRDSMSFTNNDNDDYNAAQEEDWEQISIPISIGEDYEIVLPPSGFPGPDDAAKPATTDNSSSGTFQRMREWRYQRSLQRNQLGRSISSTFAELSKEDPNQMEEEAIQRAMELSMLDVALVHSPQSPNTHLQQEQQKPPPHKILGVTENASPTEIKNAYRRLARLHVSRQSFRNHCILALGRHNLAVFSPLSINYLLWNRITNQHPDKGGEANRFEEVARAYRSLLSSSVPSSFMKRDRQQTSCLTTATCDRELQDHKRLVNDLFQTDGVDLEACVTKQLRALDILELTFRDAGAINRNERNEIIHNSCFYLSLATSYLWGIGALSFQNDASEKDEDELLVGETALQLKRTIEAAVVKAHPEWVLQGKVGEEVQAFSDFLVYTLDSHTLLSDWAITVFDATSGFCDIYKGRNYKNQTSSMKSNTITLRYIPGHYQPLIPSTSFARRPALDDITTTLDNLEVFYVVTDGNS